MLCPRCSKELCEEFHGIPLATCHSCHGTWYFASGIAKLFRMKSEDGHVHLPNHLFEDATGELFCPVCQDEKSPMLARTFKGKDAVTIDQCAGCSGVWLDAGELPKAKNKLREDFGIAGQGQAQIKPHVSFRATPVPKKETPMPWSLPQMPELVLDERATTANSGLTTEDEETRQEQEEERELEHGTAAAEVTVGIWLLSTFLGIPIEAYNPPRKRFPVMVLFLLLANTLIFFMTASNMGHYIASYGAVPHSIASGHWLGLFTYMFLHIGLLHLFGNMYFLWVFGDNVEDKFGSFPFSIFYVVCGLAAILCQLAASGKAGNPVIGASGAVAGVMGAYLYFFPKAALYQSILFIPFKIPVTFYLVIWLGIQFIGYARHAPGVAWWAHIGGFFSGYIIAFAWYRARVYLRGTSLNPSV